MHFSEQINYCFILVLAYNHNIIMDGDAQRGLGIFTQTNTRRHKHKHKHTDVIQARTEHTPPPSHTHTHTDTAHRVHCSLMPPLRALCGFCFSPFVYLFSQWWEVGSAAVLSLPSQRREPAPVIGLAALQSCDLDLPWNPSLRFSSFITLSPGI